MLLSVLFHWTYRALQNETRDNVSVSFTFEKKKELLFYDMKEANERTSHLIGGGYRRPWKYATLNELPM